MRHRVKPKSVLSQAMGMTDYIVQVGLTKVQDLPILKTTAEAIEVTFPRERFVSAAMKKREYRKIHQYLLANNVFTVRMIDDGLIQMMYRFDSQGIVKHRLAFFPSPKIEVFAVYSDSYLGDLVWLKAVRRGTTPVPIRFDYDLERADGSSHPASHLTIGQRKNCRIPVSAPLMPRMFIDFVLRHFYEPSVADGIPPSDIHFPKSISEIERRLIHLIVPRNSRS